MAIYIQYSADSARLQVGACLDLKLEPVASRMEPPTAEEFHNSLQDLFKAGESLSACMSCTCRCFPEMIYHTGSQLSTLTLYSDSRVY